MPGEKFNLKRQAMDEKLVSTKQARERERFTEFKSVSTKREKQ